MDLRVLRKQLEGKRITIPRSEISMCTDSLAKQVEFTVDRVYPHHLTCYTITENGTFHKESVCVGSLITMGIIMQVGKSFALMRRSGAYE